MLSKVEMVLTFGKRNGATIQAGGEGCVNFGNAAIFTHSEGVITTSVFTSREAAGQIEVWNV